MDTAALAAAFPFTSPDLPRDPAAPDALPGVLYGVNTAGPGLVAWDRWAADNHNSVTLAASGAGKSYLAKLEILRSAVPGHRVLGHRPRRRVRPPRRRGRRRLRPPGRAGRAPQPVRPARRRARPRPDTLTRRALFLHTVIAVLLGGEPSPAERAALDKAIMTAYQQAGITADPRTWARPAPLLPALAAALRAAKTAGRDRAGRPARPVHRGHPRRPVRRADHHPPRRAPGRLLACATSPTSCARPRPCSPWTPSGGQVSDPARRRRRLITVDEAWLLMRDPEGAKFLFRLAKSARKHWAGLAAVTQDAEDVLATDLGRAVIANSATQILLRQAPQAIAKVADEFRLSAGERRCCCRPAGARGCWRPGRRPGCRSRPSPRPPSTSCARATRPRSPGCRPASQPRPARPGPARTARPTRTTRRTCCHDSPAFSPPGPARHRLRPAARPGRYLTNPGGYTGAPGPAAAAPPWSITARSPGRCWPSR